MLQQPRLTFGAQQARRLRSGTEAAAPVRVARMTKT
jgi:hypothetical protein